MRSSSVEAVRGDGARLQERSLLEQAELGVASGPDRLAVAPPGGVLDRIVHHDERVADLVELPSHGRIGAVRQPLAVDDELTSPVAVMMTLPAEVQPCSEVEPHGCRDLDAQVAGAAVGQCGEDPAALDPTVVGVETELGPN